ncbi:hypothetical protein Prudu_004690 [Prunus dulcis]|uniref:Protein FAR1-RELATED SEQUENCE n=1 Tax=Prunus dulcis TaxID=3755 RepID=A0A4Y1QVX7_PRUDU|nr:hypothetical protein Prudu_004690 [Prunus dulcis]
MVLWTNLVRKTRFSGQLREAPGLRSVGEGRGLDGGSNATGPVAIGAWRRRQHPLEVGGPFRAESGYFVLGSYKNTLHAVSSSTLSSSTLHFNPHIFSTLQNSATSSSLLYETQPLHMDMNMENNCMEDGEGETSTGLNISKGESNKKSSQAMKGILCAHALKVLSTRNVKSIPAQYILKRWTKNVKAMSAKINSSSSTNDPKVEIVRRYRELCRLHTQLATRAAGCGKAYEIVIRRLNQTFDEVDACLKEKSSQEMCEVISPVINSRSELNECINVDDDIIKARGIQIKERVVGSSKRPKNALEKLTKKRRTRKTELQNSSSVDSICVPHTKAVPAPPSEISQAQSPLEGEFGLFSSQFTGFPSHHYEPQQWLVLNVHFLPTMPTFTTLTITRTFFTRI